MQQKNNIDFYYTANVPAVLREINKSLIVTTYQLGQVLTLSEVKGELALVASPLPKPMGVSVNNDKIAIAVKNKIEIYKVIDKFLGKTQIAIPQASFDIGNTDVHEVHYFNNTIFFTNTFFSNVSVVAIDYHFQPIWKPFFISNILPGDQCHLNGFCFDEANQLKYVTAFDKSNKPAGWRNNKLYGGIVIDAKKNAILFNNLSMPHSPRLYQGNLYVLSSAKGEIVKYNLKNDKKEIVAQINGFLRGLTFFGNYMFVGVSKVRNTNNKIFSDVPVSEKSNVSGVYIFDATTYNFIGKLVFSNKVDEIFDVALSPFSNAIKFLRPEINKETLDKIVHTPFGDFFKE